MKKKKPSRFRTWIYNAGGPMRLSKKLRITPEAIYFWLRREASPGPKNLAKLKKLAGRKLTIKDIADGTMPSKRA